MDAKQFLSFQLEDAGYQLAKCYEGISDAVLDAKVADGMTPREAYEHLGDAYRAYVATLAGEKYEWGSFRCADRSWAGMWREVSEARNQAVAAAMAAEGDDALKMANAYLLGHEYYHVGQVCLVRIANDPDFDPYSIYPM